MDISNKLNELKPTDLNCNVFDVYSYDGLSMQELLCQFYTKINECVELSNTTLDLVEWLVNEGLRIEVAKKLVEWLNDGTLENLINNTLFSNLIDSFNATNNLSDYYKPISIVDTIKGNHGIPSDYSDYEQNFKWCLDKLVSENSDYITKEVVGIDQSNQFNIYKYDFKPKHYEKTILLLGCVHGNEYTGFFAINRLMEEICNNYKKDSNLHYLRNKIRIVCIPMVNPWGFVNGIRRNVNGVDLNRNSDYRWYEYVSENSGLGKPYYKGTHPNSERETQVVMDVVESIKNDNFVALVDMHTINTVQAEKILYYPRFQNNIIKDFNKFIKMFDPESIDGYNRKIFSSSALPTISNYVSWKYNVNACNPEWNNSCYGGDRSSFNMRKSVEWLGNTVLNICKNSYIKGSINGEPFIKQLIFEADPNIVGQDSNRMSAKGYNVVNSSSQIYNNMEVSSYQFELDQQYTINLSGWVKIVCEADTKLFMQPTLYQRYAPEQRFSNIGDTRRNEISINCKAGQEYIIPVNANLMGFNSNYNDEKSKRSSEVNFKIRAYCNTNSSVYINAYNLTISGSPSNLGESVVIEKVKENLVNEKLFPLRIPEELED